MTCLVMGLRSGYRIHNTATLTQLFRAFPTPHLKPSAFLIQMNALGSQQVSCVYSLVFPSKHLHIVASGTFLERIPDHPVPGETVQWCLVAVVSQASQGCTVPQVDGPCLSSMIHGLQWIPQILSGSLQGGNCFHSTKTFFAFLAVLTVAPMVQKL